MPFKSYRLNSNVTLFHLLILHGQIKGFNSSMTTKCVKLVVIEQCLVDKLDKFFTFQFKTTKSMKFSLNKYGIYTQFLPLSSNLDLGCFSC